MLFPKKVKFRKSHTMRVNPKKAKVATRGITVAFGSHGLKAVTSARVRSNQIESARKVIARSLGKTGRSWIRIFPDKPYTQKPPEVKLGKGKGDPVAGHGFSGGVRAKVFAPCAKRWDVATCR